MTAQELARAARKFKVVAATTASEDTLKAGMTVLDRSFKGGRAL